ncbi:MAG: shikimate dehydrogenase [Syntrophales bacterium]|nr:shikimate dehydrogenase [Syntrophales bacterium]
MKDNALHFALFGNPVGHSLSPLMHGAAFAGMGLRAQYSAFCVQDLALAAQGIRGMGLRGVSVTIPFKTAVMDLLDEIEETARMIGAVNTIRNDGGRLMGFNTDAAGLMKDLKEVTNLRGKRVVVLGAGGAARSAVFGLIREGALVHIVNRTAEKGERLAGEFGCTSSALSDKSQIGGDILINTTSVGMTPVVDASPLEPYFLKRFHWVVDIVYNPLKTKLLKDAEAAGCHIRNGIGMFVHQGAEQIRIWTGLTPPLELMQKVVMERLS